MAGAGQTELADPRQPHAVGNIGLAPLELLDLAGVDQGHQDAGRLQRFERRDPVDAGALHHCGIDRALAQPGHHLAEAAGQGLEGPRLDLRRAAAGDADADRCGDLHLVHVEARGAGMDDVQVVGHHDLTSRFVWEEGGGGRAGRTGHTPISDAVRFAARPRHEGREQSGARSRPAGASLSTGSRAHH